MQEQHDNKAKPKRKKKTLQRGPKASRGQVKEEILSIAKQHFSSKTYAKVTIRGIANDAGIDPALINYYFGPKDALFRASMALPKDPVEVLHQVFIPGIEGAGPRAVRAVMVLWEQAAAAESAKLLLQSLLSTDEAAKQFKIWKDTNIATPLAQYLPGPYAKERLNLAGSHIIGVLFERYIVQVEPLASMSIDDLSRIVGAVLQQYFDGSILTLAKPAS